MTYEPIIGLEIHVQLGTKTKMFCRCSSDVFGKPPNTRTCSVCLGLPGALPVTNGEAVRLALLAGEALGSAHPKISKFDRKNYFYPDLPKGYQISQYDLPLNIGGSIAVEGKKISLTRAHLEEDTGRLLHQGEVSLIDFNRSGIPLLEIVTEPVLTSAAQAKAYGQKIQQLMRYSGVSSADMEEGSLRVDANVSLRKKGSKTLGTKVEIKNMNSFRAVEKALNFEIARQEKLLQAGEKIIQETRGWVEGSGETAGQRSKEEAHDYRYFPEPDLPAIEIEAKLIASLRKYLVGRLPDQMKKKLISDYGLSDYDASILTSDYFLQEFYTQAISDIRKIFDGVKAPASPALSKKVANWLVTDFLSHFRSKDMSWENLPITPAHLAELVYLTETGKISAASAKIVLEEMMDQGLTPSEIVSKRGLILQSDIVKITALASRVLQANPTAVQHYRAGKVEAFGFLLGKLLAETGGQADPTVARQALQSLLQKDS